MGHSGPRRISVKVLAYVVVVLVFLVMRILEVNAIVAYFVGGIRTDDGGGILG